MKSDLIYLEKWGTGIQPCLPEAVAHMIARYGFRLCVDQAAAEIEWMSKKAPRPAYDSKSYWGKSRRGKP